MALEILAASSDAVYDLTRPNSLPMVIEDPALLTRTLILIPDTVAAISGKPNFEQSRASAIITLNFLTGNRESRACCTVGRFAGLRPCSTALNPLDAISAAKALIMPSLVSVINTHGVEPLVVCYAKE